MLRLMARRIAAAIPLYLLVTVIVFSLVELAPGDPALALVGENATADQIATIRDRLRLDEPLSVRYVEWASAAARGDLGTSLLTSSPVSDAIKSRFPVTLSLIGLSLLVTAIVGFPIGIAAGSRPYGLLDRVLTSFVSLGVAVPVFWLGPLMMLYLALRNPVFPATGYTSLSEGVGPWLRSLTLPAVALGLSGAAELARQTRSALAIALDAEYVRTARAKGLRGRTVVLKHALKNAMVPVVTVSGLQVARLFSIGAIVELIFGLPGAGELAVQAAFDRDLPVLQGVVLVVTGFVVVANLVVDLSYIYFNPRVRET